jgi:DNA-binding response OmpR family regulator
VRPQILIVEDEEPLRILLRYNLEAEGYEVTAAATGDEAETLIEESPPDLILLDWMLPGLSGIELCRRLRARPQTRQVPVIMLTARGEEAERVRGLVTGADDYVVKPFSAEHLEARIRAVLRRVGGSDDQPPLVVGGLQIDVDAHEATLEGKPLDLTSKEFDLLAYLASRVGAMVTKREILAEVWRMPYGGADRTVDVHLSWLRKKLGETALAPRYLHTKRGVGVKLVDPAK